MSGFEWKNLPVPAVLNAASHPYLSAMTLALVALVAGFMVQAVGRHILEHVVKRFSVAGALIRSTAHPVQFATPLLFVQMAWIAAPEHWPFNAGVTHITGLALVAALTWLVISAIRGVAATIEIMSPITVADNLQARRIQTQTRVLARCLMFLAFVIGTALVLMTFPGIRTIGTSLLASAGLAGIVAGVAARPVLTNLIAGLQIALSQPIRLDDVLIIQGEWGRVEEITSTYVVVSLWDQRRLIVPLQWFIENPFQNWTRHDANITGTVFLWVDYRMPLAPLRDELARTCNAAPEWDGRLHLLQVTDANERAVQLRALVTSADSSLNWDLRCKVREALVDLMQREYPQYLPRTRNELYEPARQQSAIPATNRGSAERMPEEKVSRF